MPPWMFLATFLTAETAEPAERPHRGAGIAQSGANVTVLHADVQPAAQPARDAWFGPDKIKHVVVAFAAQSGSYATLRLAASHDAAIVGATTATLGLSVYKELRDRPRTGFSIRDLAWDAAGVAIATVLVSQTPRR